MAMQTVSFRADTDKVAALDVLATAERRDRTFILNEAIDQYLAQQHRLDDLTREGLMDVDAGRLVEHDEVRAWAARLESSKRRKRDASVVK